MATVEAGGWGDREAELVVIPATLGLDLGIWYRVRGVMVRDKEERPVAWVLCEPANHYYRVMTRSPWMPALIGPRI